MHKYSTHITSLKTSCVPLPLERPHLYELIETSILKPLTVIIASTGYGKTHAVKSFLQYSANPHIWLNLTELDNKKTHFWNSFIYSVSIFDRELANKIINIGFPETERQVSRLYSLLSQYTLTRGKLILVFDDFYCVQNEYLCSFLERLLELKVQDLSIILIARSKINMNLVQFMSKGMLSVIDSDRLKFDERETLRYLNLNGVNLSPLSGANIYAATQGWIFAIELVCTAMKKSGCSENYAISAMKSNIFELIETELLKPFSDDKRMFLVKLSLLDRLPEELLRLLLRNNANNNTPSQYPIQWIYDDLMNDPETYGLIDTCETEFIDVLREIHSFLFYDVYTNMFSFHNLFKEYLVKLQTKLTKDDQREVFLTSANYYVSNNYKIEAICCLQKIQAYKEIEEIVNTMPQYISAADAKTLLEIVESAPADLPENELLYILHPRLLMLLGRYDEAEAEYRANIQAFEAVPQSGFDYLVLAANYVGLGFLKQLTSLYTRDYDTVYYFESAYNYYKLSNKKPVCSINVCCVSSYAARVSAPDKGEIQRCIEEFSISVNYIINSMNGCMHGMDDLGWAELYFFQNNLKKSEKMAWQALYKARGKDQFEVENRAIFYLIRIHLAMGNHSIILELLEMLQTQLTNTAFLHRYALYDAVSGWFFASIHQNSRIAEWLKHDFKKTDYLSLIHGFENLVRAKYFLCCKNYLPLLAFLSSQCAENGLGAFIYGKIEMKAMEAVCHYYLKDIDDAFKALHSAWELAEPNQLYMPFVELGQSMRTLCGAALKYDTRLPKEWLDSIRKKSSTYAKKAGYVASEYRLANWVEADKPPIMTKREIKLLTDLYHGLSRSEIAASNNMSINTVKAALQLIYEKLGANNAVDAVRIATALNALE